ncbi:MAG: biotin--[acetyl-CoA-carboxylase] ligase [Rhodospirillales bacterium]|nr:biotin--[acetyl-CoA-carboxylase] ligase [Rhodospirillales bacterium]
MPPPFRSVVLDEVGSTNREAFVRAEAGETGPLWIMARRQTAGRGRSGRQWASEPGNLYASLLTTLACASAVVPQLSLLTGVAVIDAIRQVSGDDAPAGLRLKWPNDVLIGPAKCAGILAESIAGQQSVTAVIGVGLNLAWHPAGLGRAAANLAEHGVHIAPETMLGSLAAAMQQWLETWDGGAGFPSVRDAWLRHAGPVGETCSVNTGTERLEGTFLGLESGGALLMQDREGRQRCITFGDVVLPGTDARDAS